MPARALGRELAELVAALEDQAMIEHEAGGMPHGIRAQASAEHLVVRPQRRPDEAHARDLHGRVVEEMDGMLVGCRTTGGALLADDAAIEFVVAGHQQDRQRSRDVAAKPGAAVAEARADVAGDDDGVDPVGEDRREAVVHVDVTIGEDLQAHAVSSRDGRSGPPSFTIWRAPRPR